MDSRRPDDNNPLGTLPGSHMRSSDFSTTTSSSMSPLSGMMATQQGIMSGRSTPLLHQQQQHMHAQRHQRQNSIPINVDAMKTIRAGAPGSPAHAGFGHRRGISLNTTGFPNDLSSHAGVHAPPRKMAARAQLQAAHVHAQHSQAHAQAQFAAAVSMGGDPMGMPPASPSVQDMLAMHSQEQQKQLQQQLLQQRQSMHSRASSHASNHSQSMFAPKNDLKAASMMTSADAMAEAYLISPHTSVQDTAFVQMFQQQQQQQQVQHQQQVQSNRNSVASFASLVSGSNVGHEYDFLGQEDALSSSSFLGVSESHGSLSAWSNDEESAHPRRHPYNDTLMERFLRSVSAADRPTTPGVQDESGYVPLTPIETPHSARSNHPEPQTIRPGRFQPGYDESMEETLKPMRKAAMMRTKSVFDDFREQAEDGSGGQSCPSSMPTPNRLANMVNKSTDALPSQARSFMDIPTFENPFVYNGMSAPLGMPQYASVDAGRVGLTAHQEMFMARPNFQVPPAPGGGDPSVHPESGRSSPMRGFLHRRSDSIASNMSAASIDSLNVDDARIETGIDLSEIETFIKGPDPTDGKWTCSFEDCDKRFGRKENIKSHVQTHLNDRQYQCPSCKKCFVRQHDLKRHAKIHTGIKPYMCDCGNSFARHDALTRHRQRGMCVGAFDGIVKKTVKRGRPRKNRPDGKDERGEKKAVHRKKTMSISSMSDLSACSDASDAASSPGSTTGFDRFRVDDLGMELDEEEAPRSENNVSAMLAGVMGQMPSQNHSFGDANAGPSNMVGQQQQEQQEHQHQQHQQHQQQQHPQHQQQQQHPQQHAYLVSDAVMAPMPIAHPRDASSRVVQAHRAASHAAPSPAKSSASHYNTPPDLSASRSSSPPLPPSGGSARLGDMSHSAGHQGGVMLRGYSTAEMQGGVSLTASDEDPNLYLIPKLEPDFDTNDFSMFSAGEAYHNPAETYAANEMYFGPT